MAYEENFQKTSEPKYDCLLFGKRINMNTILNVKHLICD